MAVGPLNQTSTPTLADEWKTYYERTLLERLLPELVHAQFGQKKQIPKNNGKTVEFRRFSPLPMASFVLTEGVTPAGQTLSETAITATVAQYGNFLVITDVVSLTSYDNILDEASELLGEQAGEFIDTMVRDVLVAGSNVLFALKVKYNADGQTVRDTAAAPITARNQITNLHAFSVDTVRTAKRIMQRNKVKPYKGEKSRTGKGEYVCIIHPDTLFDLQSDKKWIDADTYAGDGKGMFTGEVGKAYGVRFVMSELGKTWSGAGAASGGAEAYDVYGTIMLGNNAFGIIDVAGKGKPEFIYKGLGSAGTEDPLNQRQTAGWKVMFTTKILEDYAVLRIEHGFTDDAKAAGI